MLQSRTWREERAIGAAGEKPALSRDAQPPALNLVESVVVLLTVVQGKDGT